MNDPWITWYVLKAKNNMDEAEAVVKAGHSRAGISRGYYALYQAANAWMRLHRYDGLGRGHENWHHEAVNVRWTAIVKQLRAMGINHETGADRGSDRRLYNRIYRYRVRVDYKAEADPTLTEAANVVRTCRKAVDWLLEGLAREGYR